MSSLTQLAGENYGSQIRNNNSFNFYDSDSNSPRFDSNLTSKPASNPYLHSKVIDLTDFVRPNSMEKLEDIILNSKFSTVDYENGEKKSYFKLEDRFKNLQSFFDENNFNFIEYEKADLNSLLQIYDKLKTYETKFKTPKFAEKKDLLFDYTNLMGNLNSYITKASQNQGFNVILDTQVKSDSINRLYDILNYKTKDAPWLIKDSVTKSGKQKKGRISYLKNEIEKIITNPNFNSQDLLDLNYFKEDLEKLRLGKYKKHTEELIGLENIISDVQQNYANDFMISKDYFKHKRIMTKENRFLFDKCNSYSQELSNRYHISPMKMYKALVFGSSSYVNDYKKQTIKSTLKEILSQRKNNFDEISSEKLNTKFIPLAHYFQENYHKLIFNGDSKLVLDENIRNQLKNSLSECLSQNKVLSNHYSKNQLRSLSGIFLSSSNLVEKYNSLSKESLDVKSFLKIAESEFKNTISKYWKQDNEVLIEDYRKFTYFSERMNTKKRNSFYN